MDYSDDLSSLSSPPESISGDDQDPFLDSPLRRFSGRSLRSLSPLQRLPSEIIEIIAGYISDDSSLKAFILTCSRIRAVILPLDSGVWRTRFLELYDYPIIEDFTEFSIAYRVRQLALSRYRTLNFANPQGREMVVMEALKDLVLESYHIDEFGRIPIRSKNLIHLSTTADGGSTALHTFLQTALHEGMGTSAYQKLFEALHLSLSYLYLDPTNAMLSFSADRSNYDISRIYLYHEYFTTICGQQRPDGTLGVNTADLVHIVNFWNNHMCSNNEDTYVQMARTLARCGHNAKPWSGPLDQFRIDDLSQHWIGHYSCIHPLPRDRKALEERQTCAETWSNACPLTLNLTGTAKRGDSKWWAFIFDNIPAFRGASDRSRRYVRGSAPFVDAESPNILAARKGGKTRTALSELKLERQPNALTSLRMRGVVHALPDQAEIPGWSRMCFVLYKPTDTYLVAALLAYFDNHNDFPSDGDITRPSSEIADQLVQLATWQAMQQQMLQQLQLAQTQGIPLQVNPAAVVSNNAAFPANNAIQVNNIPQAPPSALPPVQPLSVPSILSKIHLTSTQLDRIEDDYHDPWDLQWQDIEYAYAYEGILTPGGKVMLGRFWMLNFAELWDFNLGNLGTLGMDIDEDPEAAFDRIGVHHTDLGTFVFWADEGK